MEWNIFYSTISFQQFWSFSSSFKLNALQPRSRNCRSVFIVRSSSHGDQLDWILCSPAILHIEALDLLAARAHVIGTMLSMGAFLFSTLLYSLPPFVAQNTPENPPLYTVKKYRGSSDNTNSINMVKKDAFELVRTSLNSLYSSPLVPHLVAHNTLENSPF